MFAAKFGFGQSVDNRVSEYLEGVGSLRRQFPRPLANHHLSIQAFDTYTFFSCLCSAIDGSRAAARFDSVKRIRARARLKAKRGGIPRVESNFLTF